MKSIYFVRHGQSLANAGGVTMEHDVIPLTDVGRRQALALPEFLPQSPQMIGVSPFIRARDTCAPYCKKLGMQPMVINDLREFDTFDPTLLWGMNGAQRRPIADAYWERGDVAQRMGERAETFSEFASRVAEFRRMTLPTLADRSVIFGHGMWIGMLVWQLMGFAVNDRDAMKAFRRFQLGLPMPNGAVYCFSVNSDGQVFVKVNEAALRQMADIAASQMPA